MSVPNTRVIIGSVLATIGLVQSGSGLTTDTSVLVGVGFAFIVGGAIFFWLGIRDTDG